ncbi:MAG: arginine--tRNA ligase [Burkholderiaceae bacterium]|nr:arginine--tRNA ligase [Burkholderiaceae bacterium]
MIRVKQELLEALADALAELAPEHPLKVAFESPKQASHGDLACTAAMQLAKPLHKNPRELAQVLAASLKNRRPVQRWVDTMEVVGPGFINLRLTRAAKQTVVTEVNDGGASYGSQPARHGADGADDKLLVEFVSANPTGPLHLGHARQAALGDALCNLFETQGWQVTREFYYNDAGSQIATLGHSTQARIKGLKPGEAQWPDPAYNGDYVADIAAEFMAKKTVKADDRKFTASGDPDDFEGICNFAVAYLRREQDLDLRAFGVRFDNYFLESSLYSSGGVEATVAKLVAAGKTYEADGALWLRSTDYGDDKDRVMKKSDASYTYFVPDVAYHIDKWARGFTKVINIQGGDHHGTVARVRAGLQAANVGVPAGYPDYVLHKMVTVMKGGQEVKISKRAGSYVTLRDLIEWTSKDAVRFFLLSRKADSEFSFDVDLALKQNDENPVFYVQYAHARICSVLRQRKDASASLTGANLSLLTAPAEEALMLKLADYPVVLARAVSDLAPHDVAFYLRELSAAFHTYYGAERFLVDDRELSNARLALLSATRQVLRNALTILGVSAPETMVREVPDFHEATA